MRCARTFSFFGRFDKVLAVRKSPETNGEAENRERILHFSFKKVNTFEFGDELGEDEKVKLLEMAAGDNSGTI